MVSNYCSKFSPEHVVDVSESNVIKILKLKDLPPEVEYSIRIKDDFQVEAHRKHMKISTRDLINDFTNTLCRYSQIDNIVNRLKITSINLRSELAYLGEKVFELVNEIDSEEDRRQISFNGKQLLLFNRHRYTSQENQLNNR